MNSILQLRQNLIMALIAVLGLNLNAYTQVQIGQDIDGEAAGDGSGFSVSMPDANTVAIGASANDGNGTQAGHVRIYTWNGAVWMQKGIDIDGEAAFNRFGWSVSMPDANTIAIGATAHSGNGTSSGQVQIYSWDGIAWVQKGLDIYGEAAGDNAGYSVSMPDANTVAIGAKDNHGNNGAYVGHVRIYTWIDNAWEQKGIDIDGEVNGDRSGASISMPDANTVAIGAPKNSNNGLNAGTVRIYTWNDNAWEQKGIDINGETAYEFSGTSVSMPDANTLAIGVSMNDGNGLVYARIYSWNGTTWIQKGMSIDGEESGVHTGCSISMPNANIIAIGSRFNDINGENSGNVRIYNWNGTTWVQKGVGIFGQILNENLGCSVSMPDSSTVAIGAPFGLTAQDAGRVRVYKLKGVQGKLYNDLNQNCINDELGIVPNVLGLIQPGNIIVETTTNGVWYLDSLPIGNYSITYDTTGSWMNTCPNSVNFTVTDPDDLTQIPSFGMVNTNPCPEPNVSIHMPFMRPGFSNQTVYVSACNANTGTGVLEDATVVVSLDDLLTVDAASIGYTSLGDNTFSFDIGDLLPGQCVDFTISTTLSTSAILDQTLCMEALLFPVDPCVLDTLPSPISPDFTPCDLPWDNSSVLVIGECISDSIVFTITNTGDFGDGDMDCFLPVRLYIDGDYIWLDSIQLVGGDSFTYSFAGDGRTWRLDVDQHPLHPGNSNPNATIELCGNFTNWTPDLVNILPHDDLGPIKDIYCGIVTGSYDPNDKTGYPLGVGDDHLIAPNGKIDYVVRFQNTGTDTAFTVVIRDTLDIDLDIFSVQSGVASHAYTFQMHGPRVLEWTFNNILLPDSTTNEPASNGFVTFTVEQVQDLPDGTEINNTVGIYFDFNEPIITNTTSHIIGREIETVSWTEEKDTTVYICDESEYEYNGFTYTQTGSYYHIIEGVSTDTLLTLYLIINSDPDLSTSLDVATITANNSNANYVWLDCNNNFAPISGETAQSFTPTENGNYAVELTENGCVDTTACVAVVTIGIVENSMTEKFVLFPNPTNGEVTIVFENNQQEMNVSLYSILGQLLKQKTYHNSAAITFEIEGPVGVYLLKLHNNNQEATIRVVKE